MERAEEVRDCRGFSDLLRCELAGPGRLLVGMLSKLAWSEVGSTYRFRDLLFVLPPFQLRFVLLVPRPLFGCVRIRVPRSFCVLVDRSVLFACIGRGHFLPIRFCYPSRRLYRRYRFLLYYFPRGLSCSLVRDYRPRIPI